MRPAFRSVVPALQALGVSSVPVVGTVAAGWSAATSLALYWCENLLGALLVAVLIARHRRLTRKRGHWRGHFGSSTRSTVKVGGRRRFQTRKTSRYRSFLSELLTLALVFNLAHGLVLALLLGVALPKEGAAPVEPIALRNGLLAMGVILLGGFMIDLARLRERPFAWVRDRARYSLGRMTLIHLTIIFGLFLAMWTGRPERFFLVFAVLKLLVDVATSLPRREVRTPEEIPAWALSLVQKANPDMTEEELREDWRKSVREDRRLLEQDEEERPA